MPETQAGAAKALQGVTFIERGWLSSNNVLLHGAPGEGATLVDTGHCLHAAQTLALVRHALGAEPPGRDAPAAEPQGRDALAGERQGRQALADEARGRRALAGESQGRQALADEARGHRALAGKPQGRRALAGEPLARIVNTHLHSDHCGGNALLQREFGAPLLVPPGQFDAARAWDEDALSYRATGQRIERFTPDARIAPGDVLAVGARRWEVLAAPGHDPHSVILFDAAHGVLISADALWGNGFGVVFPELEGESAFDDVAAVLDLIERLPVRWVLPGHGAAFQDVGAALARARSRLASFRADPARHDRHAAKVLLKYHLLEERRQGLAELRAWFAATPLVAGMWRRMSAHRRAEALEPERDRRADRLMTAPPDSLAAWCDTLVGELTAAGALSVRDGVVHDA